MKTTRVRGVTAASVRLFSDGAVSAATMDRDGMQMLVDAPDVDITALLQSANGFAATAANTFDHTYNTAAEPLASQT